MRKPFLVLVIVFLTIQIYPQTSNIAITINGIKEVKGTLKIGLFDDEAGFKAKSNPVDSLILIIHSKTESCTFFDVSHAKYAIAVYHDENEDGILNKRQFGIPEEGVGFSNIRAFKKKPPLFIDAAFFLSSDSSIIIPMFYNKKKVK